MALPLALLTLLGLALLIHSVYSAYEHSLLSATSALPLDIKLETLIATAMVIVSVVYSAQELRPIRWNEWAGKIEREGWDPNATIDAGKVRGGGGNPYRALEERKGFWDVRTQRKQFADWVRESGETK